MNPNQISESVSRIYDQVEIALWALILLGIAFSLLLVSFAEQKF